MWRAGREAGLGGSRGLSWGLWGPLGGPPGPPRRTTEEALAAPGRLWRPLGVFGGLWASRRQPLGGSGGLRELLRASPDVLNRLLSFALSHMLTQTLHPDVLPVPALTGFQKAPFAQEAHRFLKNYGPHFWPEGHHFGLEGRFAHKKCMFVASQFLVLFLEEPSYFCKSLQKNVRVRSSALWGFCGPLLGHDEKHSFPS